MSDAVLACKSAGSRTRTGFTHPIGLVLSQVLVDELGKGERPGDSALPPQLLKRSRQRRPRVLLARKATSLNAFRTALGCTNLVPPATQEV
jgi:hypothetical protein